MTNFWRYYQVGSDFYRAANNHALTTSPVQFWDGAHWRRSVLPTLAAFLDDAGAAAVEFDDFDRLPEGARP